MEELFLKLINLSVTASWMVLAVLALRLVLKKAPKWVFCVLWALVAVRLICPFTLESRVSLVPSGRPIPAEFLYTAEPQINSGVAVIDQAVNPVLISTMAPAPGDSVNPAQVWTGVLARVWLAGVAVMLLGALCSWIALRRRIRTAVRLEKNIKQSEFVDSPFVLGMICPVIYLPYSLEAADLPHVIAHERAHIRRKDHWWKPLGYLLLSIYWFDPLLWVAYILLCRDIEAACDEKVIRSMAPEGRKAYSTALLNCSVRRVRISACPLAFGETGVKERVKTVMNYKKPAFWIVLAAVIASITAAVCLLTDPAHPTNTVKWFDYLTSREEFTIDDNGVKGTLNEAEAFVPDLNYPEITLDAYPGVTFRCVGPHVEVISESGTVTVGRDFIYMAYFSDLSGDGKPELYMRTMPDRIQDSALIAYDPATGATAELPWTDEFSYILTMEDSRLWITKRYSQGDGTALEAGIPMWKNGALAIDHRVPGGVYLKPEEYPPISLAQAALSIYRRRADHPFHLDLTLTLQHADGTMGSTYRLENIDRSSHLSELSSRPFTAYKWTLANGVPAYFTDYAVIASGDDGRTLTFRPNGGAGVAEYHCGDTVLYWVAEPREGGDGHVSAAEEYLAQYYAMEAACSNITFRVDGDAEAAVMTFASEAYGIYMTSCTTGNPFGYEGCQTLAWKTVSVSDDGASVLGSFQLQYKPRDLNDPWLDVTCISHTANQQAGWFTAERNFILKREENGQWRCSQMGGFLHLDP